MANQSLEEFPLGQLSGLCAPTCDPILSELSSAAAATQTGKQAWFLLQGQPGICHQCRLRLLKQRWCPASIYPQTLGFT